MKAIIKNMDELSDSKELYESKPHPFFAIFITLVMGTVIAAVIWMYYGEMDIVSKGRGMIRPNEQPSIMRNKTGGVVIYSQLQEGKRVQKGEVLVTIDAKDLEVKKLQLQEVMSEEAEVIKHLKVLKNSILDDTSYFTNEGDQVYKQRYLQYVQDMEALRTSQMIDYQSEEIELKQASLNKESLKEKIDKAKEEMEQLELLKKSINEGQSAFSSGKSIHSIEFETYLYERGNLQDQLEQAKNEYELNKALDEEGLVAKEILRASKQKVELLNNELEQQQLVLLKQIEETLKAQHTIIEEATNQSNQLIINEDLLHHKMAKRELALEQFKTGELVKIDDQLQELEVKYQSDQRDLEGLQLSIEACSIKAPIEGTLNVIQEVKEGDLLTEGTELGKIIPRGSSVYKVEIFIPNSDIAGLKVGQEIEYQFDALPYREYGKLKGNITNISTDVSQINLEQTSGYWITGSLEATQLYGYKDKPAYLKIGMNCNAYIITEQKKILYYLLEKINLKE